MNKGKLNTRLENQSNHVKINIEIDMLSPFLEDLKRSVMIMLDANFKKFDDVLAEQNKLMVGKPFKLSEEEKSKLDKDIKDVIKKNTENIA